MKHKYKPSSRNELKEIIEKEIVIQGYDADLNMIDTSLIIDMKNLFAYSNFNGNISNWNVSNVIDMEGIFENSKFNGDISKWNVSNVTNMYAVFRSSNFNGDISQWNVSNVKNMCCMFVNSVFNKDISQWNVSNVKDISDMFFISKFSGDISDWDVSNVKHAKSMMIKSNIPDKIKAAIMLKLSKNDNCIFDKVIEGYNGGNNVVEFVLNNFKYKDICYAFEKADVPYENISHLLKKLLKIDCLFDVYPELHGEMINDILSV